MTENKYNATKWHYDHDAVMRLHKAIIKMSGTEHDPTYLVCAFLQQAVDRQTFKRMLEICEMSNTDMYAKYGKRFTK